MSKMRLSLSYLAAYLLLIGLGLLALPAATLEILQSNGSYGDVFPRVAGMLMTGLGITVVGMIKDNTAVLYPATLGVRAFFLICIGGLYALSGDPLFLVLFAIVALGFVLTLGSFIADRRQGYSPGAPIS